MNDGANVPGSSCLMGRPVCVCADEPPRPPSRLQHVSVSLFAPCEVRRVPLGPSPPSC